LELLNLGANQSLQAVLAAGANPNPVFQVTYFLRPNLAELLATGVLNGTTPVSLIGPPSENERIIVKDFTIFNPGSSSCVVDLRLIDGAESRQYRRYELGANECATPRGVLTSQGVLKAAGAAGGGDPGGGGTGIIDGFALRYKYDSFTDSIVPASGQIRFYTTNIATATGIGISTSDRAGNAIGLILDKLAVGSLLYIGAEADIGRFFVFEVAAYTGGDNDYKTYTLVPLAGAGALVNDEDVSISWTVGSANVQAVWDFIPASQITPRTVSGCAAIATRPATTIGRPDVNYLAFDPSVTEFAQFLWDIPNDWDLGSIQASFVWSNVPESSGTVVWGIQGVAIASQIDVAYGAARVVANAAPGSIQRQLLSTPDTDAIAIASTFLAVGQTISFQIYRDATSAEDTCADDVDLIGVRLKYTTNPA
jgi:hypothetical protein